MRMEIERRRIKILPDTPQDVAFIEEVLGLHQECDTTTVVRRNVIGTHTLAYIVIVPREETTGD